jgi:hypothetical protein
MALRLFYLIAIRAPAVGGSRQWLPGASQGHRQPQA